MTDTTLRPADDGDVESLLQGVAQNDSAALGQLLERIRAWAKRLAGRRLDRRLAARVDASDVAQHTCIAVVRRLRDYLDKRPLSFYPWVHQIAKEQLAHVRRRHQGTQRRSIDREARQPAGPGEDEIVGLVNRVVARDPSPSAQAVREEQRQAVLRALDELPENDRRVLVMHYLEQCTLPEIAARLGIGESAAKMRHLRALRRLRAVTKPGGGSEAETAG